VLVSDDGPCGAEAIAATILGLRRRADMQDDAYFAFRGLAGARALHQTLPRLSCLVTATPSVGDDQRYVYPQSRHPLPADLARATAAWSLSASIGRRDTL
jgi:hypothetical protein